MQVFKWEERKAWDVLLTAFLQEFGSSERVSLTLLTHPFHGESDFASQMHAWATEKLNISGTDQLYTRLPSTLKVYTPHTLLISGTRYGRLKASIDAFTKLVTARVET